MILMFCPLLDGDSADVEYFFDLLPHLQRSSRRSQPVVHDAVALQAIRREPLCPVVGRLRFSKIIHMTAHTLGRQALPIKWTDRAYFVTGIAFDRRMRPYQGKAVLVLVDVVDRNLPTGVSMTQIALRGVFSPVDIGVAVLTLIADLAEDKISVAVLAAHTLVHPSQRKTGLAVIELKHVAEGLPTLRCVAILAGDLQRTMWTLLWARRWLRCNARRQPDLEKQKRVQQQQGDCLQKCSSLLLE